MTVRRYFAPGTHFAMIVIFCLALAGALVWLATQQAWLGLRLDVDTSGNVVIERIAKTGPVSQSVPGSLTGALVGSRLISLAPVPASQSGAPSVLEIEANDLIEEPDAIRSPDLLSRFYERQDQISKALRHGPVTLEIERAGQRETITVQAAPKRPLVDLPLKLWLQLFVALTGALVGAWVVCLRTRDPAAWMFLVAGVGLAMASASAALYSARELALSGPVFAVASRINSSGSLIFGIGMVTLFLLYPRRIVPRAALWLPAAAIGGAVAYIQLVDWPRNLGLLQDVIAVTMVVLLVAIIAQVIVNRRDARARAMLGWLGLSIGLGAGGFVFTSIVPTLLNLPAILEQSTAFLFFLLIYVGMAMGVLRYRLFDLATWSFGIMFYGFGVALLLLLDAALIFGLSLDRAPALGIALATVGIVYLPLREAFGRWLRRNRTFPAEVLYKRITEIAHAMDPVQQQALLQAFWTDLFNPLRVTALPRRTPTATALLEDGASLTIAPVGGLEGVRLDWAQQGARLFSSADLARAVTLNAMIERSLQQHLDYVEAITRERLRINRDMHDNIGVLLLGALHATSHERKDLLIRQTLSDLREIISNPDQTNLPLPQLIADLRAEITDHLEAVDINVRWRDHGLPNALLPPKVVHTLRAFLRESTSNVVRHSAASAVEVELREEDGQLFLTLQDDGKGFDAQTVRLGNGFKNLAARVDHLGGAFDIASTPAGTRISARIPLQVPAEGPNIADERSAAE
ncbi:sensor histidine kinase [Rhodalgimonas zhirmunskyi]|uniref:histidine kinase n=1 Tax=Rhodalgimonas zhirmunskyi TaxID=2964767 RepID=A0AAJ1X6T5_9RHOB|nr:ATP-binding protein [Rhodoalgimonas zhirmunskyi]MDQ2093817.1 ATPase [Rhodoalgimonas zhirmunskyi]